MTLDISSTHMAVTATSPEEMPCHASVIHRSSVMMSVHRVIRSSRLNGPRFLICSATLSLVSRTLLLGL